MNTVGKEIADLFYDITEDDLFELMQFFNFRHVAAGEVLWREGEASDFVAFIVSGRLQVKKATEFEGKQVVVGIYSAGTIIGEMGLIEHDARSVTAAAIEESSLITLNRESFDRLIESHPRLGVKLLKSMFMAVSMRLQKSFDRLAAVF